MRLVATRKSQQNRAVLDPWSAVHFSSGLASGLIEAPFLPVLTLAVAYEVAEQYFERHPAGKRLFKTSGPESSMNAVLDVVVFVGGYWLGRDYNRS